MNEIMSWITQLIRDHGGVAVFVGVLIESIIVPIPSPLIIMGAGVILIPPLLPWRDVLVDMTFKIVLPGAIASTMGAYLTYALAYWGGKSLINRFRGFLGFGWDSVLALEKRLKKHAALSIFLLRAFPVIPLSLISAAAGGLRMSAWTFTWATFAGSIPRCYLLAWLGHLTRDSYEGLAGHVNRVESLVSAAIVVGMVGLVFYLRRRAAQLNPAEK